MEEMDCTVREAREKYAALKVKMGFTEHEGEGEEIREGIFIKDRVVVQTMLVQKRRMDQLEGELEMLKARTAEKESELAMWRQIERENIAEFGWVRE